MRFLDLFAGAGGLSEGFIRAGFMPVAHVESDTAACFTLKTRMAFHWLKKNDLENQYLDYLRGRINRTSFYQIVPEAVTASVINSEIKKSSLPGIFKKIDALLGGKPLDLIVGGPPCQAYSLVGRSRDKNGMLGDSRNNLYKFYAEFLKRYQPEYFVFENVTGLLSAKTKKGKLYFDAMLSLFKSAGYETEHKILAAKDYGVLQNRRRVILVGKRGKGQGFYPMPESWIPSNVVVNEIFKDLPAIQAGEGSIRPCQMNVYKGTYLLEAKIKNGIVPVTFHVSRKHNKRDLEIYKIAVRKWNDCHARLDYNDLPERLKTHNNRSSFLDRFKVIAGNQPYSHTIVAHISQDGHFSIHPDIDQNRSITPREAARLQTFPDDYFFESATEIPGYTAAFRQIGNAVPVLLAEKIAERLLEVW